MRKNAIFGSEVDSNGPSGPNGHNGDHQQQMSSPEISSSNHIYFYSPVTPETILRLNQQIQSLTIELQCQALRFSHTPANIFLHISSGGGYLMDGLNAVDTISNNAIPITTIVEGMAASAATLMSVAGAKRQIKRNSYMLIHQLRTAFWGTYQELEDDMENSKALMRKIKEIYKKYTKVPMKDIDEILKHDMYWESDKCKEFGLIDEII